MSDSFGSSHPGAESRSEPSRIPITHNAFHVLGLTPRANWSHVMQAAEALVDALEAGDPEARRYHTPLGPRFRTAADVQRAMTRLRDPDERIQHEIWWETPARGMAAPHDDTTASSVEAWPDADAWPNADAAWGWRGR